VLAFALLIGRAVAEGPRWQPEAQGGAPLQSAALGAIIHVQGTNRRNLGVLPELDDLAAWHLQVHLHALQHSLATQALHMQRFR
jgi:hypothetical protein